MLLRKPYHENSKIFNCSFMSRNVDDLKLWACWPWTWHRLSTWWADQGDGLSSESCAASGSAQSTSRSGCTTRHQHPDGRIGHASGHWPDDTPGLYKVQHNSQILQSIAIVNSQVAFKYYAKQLSVVHMSMVQRQHYRYSPLLLPPQF